MRRFTVIALSVIAFVPCAASIAQTGSGPTRKPGWWEMEMVILRGEAAKPVHLTVHICTDPSVDKVQSPLHVNMLGRFCQEHTARSETGWTVSGLCESNDIKISQDAVATGDMNDRYHVDVLTNFASPPSRDPEVTKMSIEARWLGQCPADKKPGDTDGYPVGRLTGPF